MSDWIQFLIADHARVNGLGKAMDWVLLVLVLIALAAVIFGFWQLLFGGSKHLIEHTKRNAINGESMHSG